MTESVRVRILQTGRYLNSTVTWQHYSKTRHVGVQIALSSTDVNIRLELSSFCYINQTVRHRSAGFVATSIFLILKLTLMCVNRFSKVNRQLSVHTAVNRRKKRRSTTPTAASSVHPRWTNLLLYGINPLNTKRRPL